MAAGAAIVTAGLATSSGIVSAHHPVLTAVTSRPCGTSSPWTATVTAESDADYNKNWRSQHRVENPTWSAWSSFSSWVDDQTDYVVPQITNIPSTRRLHPGRSEVGVAREGRSWWRSHRYPVNHGVPPGGDDLPNDNDNHDDDADDHDHNDDAADDHDDDDHIDDLDHFNHVHHFNHDHDHHAV